MTETGQHLQSCTVNEGTIWGIAIIPGTEEAFVTLPEKRSIQFFNITSFTLGRQIRLNVSPYGVTVVKDNVIVGSSSGKVVYIDRVSGKCLKTLNIGNGIILSIVSVVNDKDELLYCCENTGGNMVMCLKFDGTRIFSQLLNGPVFLALDSEGSSYVTAHRSSDLHRLSSDARVDNILLGRSDGLDMPLAVAFNRTFEKLYISNGGKNKSVLIFNCK
ncbi:unnamed protein product [Mytilus coruscus]|uniref:TRIM2_3 n=1 Tax=Mytilus coruscus TaxID=42192 RepID=A0A6J8DTS5_MYTCO|nr:unnamed protein product [Mytilus coruscus]